MITLKGVERPEGVVEVVLGDLIILDVEAFEDRLVEQASLLIVAASVQLFRGFQEFEGGLDEACAVGEVGTGGVEPFGQATSLGRDVAELGFDLGLRQRAVGGEVDQVLLLRVEFPQLDGNLLVQEPRGGFLFADDGVDVRADLGDELRAEPDAGVVALDGLFDLVDVDVRTGAEALALVAAEEIQVLVAVAVDRALDREPLLSAGTSAEAAEHRALEVMVVNAAAFPCCGPGFEDLLDLVEELFVVDEHLVSAADFLVLVVDVAEVVAVTQHLRQLVDRDLLRRVPVGGTRAQAAVVQLIGELIEGVVAGGVELEGEFDEW